MGPNTQDLEPNSKPFGTSFFERLFEEGWTYIKTVVDVVRQPILILNKDLCVMAANESFYKMFHVEEKDTTHTHVYELGNGQWNIPALRKLLEDILPKNTFFKGFEVTHDFLSIGHKVMILNARQIYLKEGDTSKLFPHIILLAFEDVTEMMAVADSMAAHTTELETTLSKRTQKLEVNIEKLQKEMDKLKLTRAKQSV